MYKNNEKQIMISDDFFLPFGGRLNKENRWVKLANIIPWWKFEETYNENFQSVNLGEEAKSVRVALGTLIIQTKLATSDRETVNQIAENPYLQYFLGFPKFQEGQPFAPSLITYFRKRSGPDFMNEINETIAGVYEDETENEEDDSDKNEPSQPSDESETKEVDEEGIDCKKEGQILVDATCAPADIQFPTDIRLLNEGREKLEEIIDVLHNKEPAGTNKPRTYRNNAHDEYIAFTKLRKPKKGLIRKTKGKFLRYIRRDMKFIEDLSNRHSLENLSCQQYKNLLVIQELYRQQFEMYNRQQFRTADRIVSISQPHVRPIVRGKASAAVEFGAKLSISVVNGFAFCEKLEWDAYNEGITLIDTLKRYKEKYGVYPEAVLADKIYRNRGNIGFCKARGIRLSGPKLGRSTAEEKKTSKKKAYEDSCERNEIEGTFGTAKRKLTLDCIMGKLSKTSESMIILNLVVLNLEKRLRLLLRKFLEIVILSILKRKIAV